MSSFGDFTKADSLAQIEGKLRQDCLSYSRRGARNEVALRDIMTFAKELITSSKTRLAMVERTTKWLKEQGVKVWQ